MVIYKPSGCLSTMLMGTEHPNLSDVLKKNTLNNKA